MRYNLLFLSLVLSFVMVTTLIPNIFAAPTTMSVQNESYQLTYDISGGIVQSISADEKMQTLSININTQRGGGNFTIYLPNNIVNATDANGNPTPFLVLTNGDEQAAQDNSSLVPNTRVLTIPFNDDAHHKATIVIVATAVPEFGPTATLIMIVAIIFIIAISFKTKLHFNFR